MGAPKWYDAFVQKLPALTGKCVAITGTTSGTGYWCAVAAAKKGPSSLLLLNRQSRRAEEAHSAICAVAASGTEVHSVDCDLSSFSSTRLAAKQADRISNKYGGLDVLIENAGIMAVPDDRTEDGYDLQMQVNHLSHFLLTSLLLPTLENAARARGEARVVSVSSAARFFTLGEFEFGDTMAKCEPNTLGGNGGAVGILNFAAPQMVRYFHSKLANAVFAQALHKRLAAKGSKVKAICCDPGLGDTHLMQNGFQVDSDTKISSMLSSFMRNAMNFSGAMQSAPDAAMPMMQAAFAADVSSGDMYCPEKKFFLPPPTAKLVYNKGLPKKTIAAGEPVYENDSKEIRSINSEYQSVLWTKSEDAVGIKFSV